MGMAFPLIGIANRSARKANTQVTMQKVETAIRLFVRECGALPWGGDPWAGGMALNNLGSRLATNLTETERQQLEAALQAADARFAINASSTPTYPGAYAYASGTPSVTQSFTGTTGFYRSGESGRPYLQALTRLAIERARTNIIAGNWEYAAPKVSGGAWVDGGTANRVVNPGDYTTTAGRRGLCIDYLSSDLPAASYADPQARDCILDAYRQPLVYIAPVTAGVSGFVPSGSSSGAEIYPPFYALDRRSSRSPTRVLAGDRRTSGAPDHVLGHELWSSGPDLAIDPLREAASARDDVSMQPYHAGLL
jgi:hypothetical protein